MWHSLPSMYSVGHKTRFYWWKDYACLSFSDSHFRMYSLHMVFYQKLLLMRVSISQEINYADKLRLSKFMPLLIPVQLALWSGGTTLWRLSCSMSWLTTPLRTIRIHWDELHVAINASVLQAVLFCYSCIQRTWSWAGKGSSFSHYLTITPNGPLVQLHFLFLHA